MMKSSKKFILGLLIAILWIVIYSLRILNLDADMPNYGIAFYQQIDEGSYGYLALNQLNYGCINPDIVVDKVEQYTAPHLRTNLVGNLLTFICVKAFGDTYYGYRLGSIICMFFNYILIFLLLLKVKKSYGESKSKSKHFFSFFCVMLTLDFSFTLASRIVETSIYRMFFVLLIVVTFAYMKKENFAKFALLGFLSVFSVFGIYITNIFLVIACILYLVYLYITENKKIVLKYVLGFFVGGMLALLICELYMWAFWKVGLVQNTLLILSDFSNIEGYIETGANGRFYYFLNFLCASFNLYNPAILMLTLCAVPVVSLYVFKKREKNMIFLILIYVCMFIQTMFSEDYIIRKYIIVAPIIIAIIYYFALKFEDIVISWNKSKKILFSLCAAMSMIITIGLSVYRLKFVKDNSAQDFSWWDKRIIFGVTIITTVLLLYCIWACVWNTKPAIQKKACFFVMLSSFVINIYMNWNYIYTNLTFADRDIMIELNNMDIQNKYIVGQYMLGFTLYNDYVPVVNYYDSMEKTLMNNKDWYFFDYSTNWNPGMTAYIEGIITDSEYHIVMEKEFVRETKTLGSVRNVALYRVEKIN